MAVTKDVLFYMTARSKWRPTSGIQFYTRKKIVFEMKMTIIYKTSNNQMFSVYNKGFQNISIYVNGAQRKGYGCLSSNLD